MPRRTPPDLVELYKIILMPKTVLIVEDNELNMKLFHNLLEAQRYLLLQTKDGKEALQVLREHRPDLVLMDIQLPEVSRIGIDRMDQGRR